MNGDHPITAAMSIAPELKELILESDRLASNDDWGDRALEVNRRLSEAFPLAVGARLRFAGCLLASGDLRSAIAEYEEAGATALDSRNREFAQRKSSELRAAMNAQSETQFEVAQRTSIDLRNAGDPESALHWHRRAYALALSKEQKALALAAAASTLRGLRKFKDAERVARRAVEVNPNPRTNQFAHTALVAALVDAGQLHEACRRAEELLACHPTDEAVRHASGRAFYALAERTGDDDLRARGAACFRLSRDHA